MKRVAIVVLTLMYLGCAPVDDDGIDDVVIADQIEREAEPVEIASQTQAIRTQPWGAWGDFATAWDWTGGAYGNSTHPNFARALSSPNSYVEVQGYTQSGHNTTFTHSSVAWSFTMSPTPSGQNPCVIWGCYVDLCFENITRGWGTCTAVIGQGTTSYNMELHNDTSHFSGLKLYAYDTGRWTLYVTSYGYWPSSVNVTDFSIDASGSF